MIDIIELNHVTIIVRDVAVARQFYCGVLGLEPVPLPPAFTHATFWFRKGHAELHMVVSSDAAQAPGDPASHPEGDRDLSRARHFAFAVSDLDAAARTLAEHGIPVALGPRSRGDGAWQLFCYDPDKHLVELHTLPA